MNDDFKKIITILKYLDVKINAPSDSMNFESRMILQKLTYICQSIGMVMRYTFNLYIYGPYSPTLAADYYKNPQLIKQSVSSSDLNQQEIKACKKLKQHLVSHDLFQAHKVEFLEAVATLFYFKNLNSNYNDDELFKKTKENKPYLRDRIIIIALNVVKELIFDKDQVTSDLKQELDIWEKAED